MSFVDHPSPRSSYNNVATYAPGRPSYSEKFNVCAASSPIYAAIPNATTVKRSLKHFSEQAFLIDLAGASWKDIDLIPSVEPGYCF